MPPGTPRLVGERRVERPSVRLFLYDEETLEERDLLPLPAPGEPPAPLGAGIGERIPPPPAGRSLWIHVDGLDPDLLERIGSRLGLHPLAVEDLLDTTQRPKAEDYGSFLLLILKDYARDEGEPVPDQLGIVLGDRWILSVQERPGNPARTVAERLRTGRGRLRRLGPDAVAYALTDVSVDGLFDTLDRLGERIEDLEDRLVLRPDRRALAEIHALRREVLALRHHLWPVREAVAALERGESSLVSPEIRPYLRDAHDHAIQAIDLAETCRDTLSGLLDLYLSSASWKLNESMMELTVIATVFMPLTFIAGVYGMNFRHMPELSWRYGYAGCWAAMLALAGWMVLRFRRKGWLGRGREEREEEPLRDPSPGTEGREEDG